MHYHHLEHRFVTHIPRELEPGVLYISIAYATAMHACCCGCGEQVVTPLTPTDWKLIFDGETVSLWPSIGNWNFACRSHYIIEHNRVVVARPWSEKRVAQARAMDKIAKTEYFGLTSGKIPAAETIEERDERKGAS